MEFVRHKGSRALQLPFDMPDLTRAQSALADEWGKAPVTIGSGGSIPIVGDFKRTLGLDTLLVGFGLDDDRVHSPNEKYDLPQLPQGHALAGQGFWPRWRSRGTRVIPGRRRAAPEGKGIQGRGSVIVGVSPTGRIDLRT